MIYTDPESARTINRLRILNLIHQNREISRAELSRQLKLNKVTVSAIVAGLLEENLAVELGKSGGAPGRNAMALGINSGARLLLVFDVGLWKTRYGACDLSGRMICQEEVFTPEDHRLEVFLDSLGAYAGRIRENLPADTVFLGAALAVSGLVDSAAGVVKHSPNWEWRNVDLRERLSRRLGLPVVMDNNVRAMLLGERWFGEVGSGGTVFYINWAQGIGSALMVENRILPVDSEFGHLQVSEEGACSCGKAGCVEVHASGRALRERGNRLLGTTDLSAEELSGRAGTDPRVAELFRFAAVCIGRGASAVANILSPRLIILGGGLAPRDGETLRLLREEFDRQTMVLIREKTGIAVSRLGDSAGLLGAAALGLDHFFYKRSSLATLKTAGFP